MASGDVNLISDHGKRLTRDTEFLHSFLRVDDESGSDSGEGANKGKSLKKKPSADVLLLRNTEADKKRERERPRSPGSPPPAGPTTFQQLSKEIKMKAKQAGTKQVRGRRVKVRRQEEVYTDKDRAAAVNMGSRDIKQSLKMKRRQDRSRALQIPEEAEPGTMLALGYHELRTGDVNIAINFVNKALELCPTDKNALVARSKCYLLLGEPQLALQDAETAMEGDKSFIKAIFQKAEALYHLGDFEHSLMYYHRGLRIRPELEGFRLGVQKAQEAIENTIGSKTNSPLVVPPSLDPFRGGDSRISSAVEKRIDLSSGSSTGRRSALSSLSGGSKSGMGTSSSKISRSRPSSETRKGDSGLLGELYVDKKYLEQLLKHPDIRSLHQEASNKEIRTHAEEGVAFLRNRQEFWRQQKSNTTITLRRDIKKKQNSRNSSKDNKSSHKT